MKFRLRKQVYYFLLAIILLIVATLLGINRYKEKKYHETNQYKLLSIGYNENEIDTILNKLNDEKNINFILDAEYKKEYVSLLEEKYFLEKNYIEYINYMKKNIRITPPIAVRNINIHLNKPFYELEIYANTSLNEKMLVNKYYKLPDDYEPDDLAVISQNYSWGDLGTKKMRSDAYEAFIEMWQDAKDCGYYLMINMAYHSYEDQDNSYNYYKNLKGEIYADSMAARAGHSEHQTGLAIDVFSKLNSNKATFKDSETAKWLKDNSYKYGFILRYPEDKENITGFKYEAWHYRYVGKDIARKIYNEGITLEEYYAYYIEK